MSESVERSPLVRAAAIAALPEFRFAHPLNPGSEVHLRALGALAGLERVGILIGRVPPGKESFVYHSHQHEEEFIYVLSGRGIAEIGAEEMEVGPGDFMGFPAPSVGHHLRNPFAVDLVYLMGGEHRPVDIADFPRLRKRLVRNGDEFQVVDWEALGPFWK